MALTSIIKVLEISKHVYEYEGPGRALERIDMPFDPKHKFAAMPSYYYDDPLILVHFKRAANIYITTDQEDDYRAFTGATAEEALAKAAGAWATEPVHERDMFWWNDTSNWIDYRTEQVKNV